MGAAYGSAGERCMAISVAVPVGEEDRRRADRQAEAPRRGPEDRPGTDNSNARWARWSPAARDKVAATSTPASPRAPSWWSTAAASSVQGYENGFFVGGTLFDRVTPDMKIYRDEIFGPVLSVVRAASMQEAWT
jgi:malonate-semialdehyde dehydrogenase (acetylating) / methylmalonate-semialdehyde dehydrogenase